MMVVKIVSVQVYKKDLHLMRPYTIAFKTITSVENVFVEIHLSNGIIGFGACNPSEKVIGFNIQQTFQTLQSPHLQQLIGKEIADFYPLLFWAHTHFGFNPSAVAAIDIALHDAFTQSLKMPLTRFLGQVHHALPTSITIGIKNVHDTLADAKEYLNAGFTHLKIKLGLNYDEDIERLIKLRELTPTDVMIRVDANQGYSLDQTLHFFESVKRLNIEFVEQPISVVANDQYQQLPAWIKTQIALDESILSVKHLMVLHDMYCLCGIVNIKLMKCGGITPALHMATLAKSYQLDLMWGCNDESAISIAAALHTAFACSHTKYIDLDGSFDLGEDRVNGGFVVEKGVMKTTQHYGLGLTSR